MFQNTIRSILYLRRCSCVFLWLYMKCLRNLCVLFVLENLKFVQPSLTTLE